MTRVLPEPGPARIKSGPSTCDTASRWCGFRTSRRFFPGRDPVWVAASTIRVVIVPCTPSPQNNCSASTDCVGTPRRRFSDLNSYRKPLPQILEVGDDQDLLELGLDRLNGFDNAIAPVLVLRPEAFIHDQRLQPRAGSVCQQARQRDANREVHAKALATAEH